MRLSDPSKLTKPMEMKMKHSNLLFSVFALLAVLVASSANATPIGTVEAYKAGLAGTDGHTRHNRLDAVGDSLRVIYAPVQNWLGVSVAANCRGDLFYTNYLVDTLYKMDAWGNLTGQVPMMDAATGAAMTFGEMSWDEGRQMLWAGTDIGTPARIFLLDPVTGFAYYQFDGMGGFDLTDGIAFDPTDGTVWHSTDVSDSIAHFTATGLYLGSLTPLDAAGGPQGSISGICVGTGNTMYVGHDGLGVVTRVDKTTGAYLSTFAVPGGRDEGLECDPINFAPNLVIWCKGAYDNSFTAFEVESGTCVCYQPPDTCELPFQEVDLGDLPACNYPTLARNPAHALTNVAWLGAGISGEPAPNILDADPFDDGVFYYNLPWTPCTVESVMVTVTAGPMYGYYVENCGGHLYLNGWKDGNLDGDFCDTLCAIPGAAGGSEWIVQDVLVAPGVYTFSFIDPGVSDLGVYDGVFRWRLTSVPVGRFGFGMADPGACPNMTCGTYAFDRVGEVEDYIIQGGQLAVELRSFEAVPGDRSVTLRWSTATETDNDHFEVLRDGDMVGRVAGAMNSTVANSYSWADANVHNGVEYHYSLIAVDANGTRKELGSVNATPSTEAAVITEYALHQNYPNPFNPTTSISFDLVQVGHVNLSIYNLLGQRVATLVNGTMESGRHVVAFNAGALPSGVYIYRLEADAFVSQRKMMLMK
jgi:streptogramin lyase